MYCRASAMLPPDRDRATKRGESSPRLRQLPRLQQGSAESVVQQRIIRLQRGRPFVACDRLVEPPELGEGRAEKAMARRSVRHQLEFPEHSGLGLFEPALAQKRVGA